MVPAVPTEITPAPAPAEYLIGLDGVVSFDLPTLSEDPCRSLDSVTVTEVSGVGGTDIPCKANMATLKIECEIGYPDVAAYGGRLLDFEVTMRGALVAYGGAYLWELASLFQIDVRTASCVEEPVVKSITNDAFSAPRDILIDDDPNSTLFPAL